MAWFFTNAFYFSTHDYISEVIVVYWWLGLVRHPVVIEFCRAGVAAGGTMRT